MNAPSPRAASRGRLLVRATLLLLAFCLPLHAATKPPTAEAIYCHFALQCPFADPSGQCADEPRRNLKLEHTKPSDCAWYRSFVAKGVVPGRYESNEMWKYFGAEYKVTYAIADTLPVPFAALDHLVDNIPVAAKLINTYRKTAYSASYPIAGDSLFFKGTNGRNLSGQARMLWMRGDKQERVYYGVGRVRILKWGLVGNVVVEYHAWPRGPRSSNYQARFTMFPANAVINSIMNMGMFRSVAIGKIDEVLTDIGEAAKAYAARKPAVVKNIVFTPAEREVLKEFERLYPR